MPRRPRVHLDGIPLHIVPCGYHREPCFFGDEDCFTYLHWLGQALQEAQCSSRTGAEIVVLVEPIARLAVPGARIVTHAHPAPVSTTYSLLSDRPGSRRKRSSSARRLITCIPLLGSGNAMVGVASRTLKYIMPKRPSPSLRYSRLTPTTSFSFRSRSVSRRGHQRGQTRPPSQGAREEIRSGR